MRWRAKPESPKDDREGSTSVVLGPVEEPGRLRRAGRAVARVLSTRFLLPTVVGVLVVALAVVTFLNVRHGREDDAASAARKTVTATVERLLTYSPATILPDLDDKLDLLTGDFRDEYETLVKGTTAPAAQEQNISTKAVVVASGVEERGADEVEVVLFINVSYTTPDAEEPTVQGSRVRVTAEKTGGSWKISSLEPV